MRVLSKVVASAIFLGFVGFEVYHDLIAQEEWQGHTPAANYVVFIHAPLWLLAAASLWFRSKLAWYGVLPGILSSFVHGVASGLGGSSLLGAMFVVAAPVLFLLTWYGRRAHLARGRLGVAEGGEDEEPAPRPEEPRRGKDRSLADASRR